MAYLRDLYSQFRAFPPIIRTFYFSDIFFAFSQSIFAALFNLHLLAIGYTPDHVGEIQSVNALVLAAVGIPIGLMADRWGRRWLYVAGSILFGLPYMVVPFVREYPVLMAVMVVSTLGNALMFIIESPLLAGEVETEQRASVFSFMMVNFFLWNTLGIQVAGLLARWLPAGALSEFQWPLVVAGVFGLASGLMRMALPFKPHVPATAGRRLSLRPSRTALLLGLVSMVTGASTALMFGFNNVILARKYHLDASSIATVLTVAGLVGWLGSVAVPALSRRLGELRSLTLVMWLQGLGFLLMGVVGPLPAFLGVWMVRGFLATMQMPLFTAFSMEVAPDNERASASSYAMVGRNVGQAVAAKGYGLLLAGGNFMWPFAVAGVFALGGVLVLRWAFGGQSRTEEAPVGVD